MSQALRRLTETHAFHATVFLVILVAAVVVGLETYPALAAEYGQVLQVLDAAIIAVFVAEIAIRIAAEGRRPWQYFTDPWNVFDFGIVVLTAIPMQAHFAPVLRLVRILRVLRLLKALPRLRLIVHALLKTVSSMGYVGLLLLLHFYMFGVIGVSLFGRNDPLNFGSLERAFFTLFRVLTLDGWIEVATIQRLGAHRFGYDGLEYLLVEPAAFPVIGPLYFVAYILVGTVVILNLFVGVITSAMSEAQQEAAAEAAQRTHVAAASGPDGVTAALVHMEGQLDALKAELAHIRQRLPAG